MTKEKAREILGMLDKGGEVDEQGYVSGCCVWTSTIRRILDAGELIFFDDSKGKLCISNWPEDLDERPKAIVKFKGFNGEEMELRITDDCLKDSSHDHLEIWCEGKKLGMMHICKIGLYIWIGDTGRHVYFK